MLLIGEWNVRDGRRAAMAGAVATAIAVLSGSLLAASSKPAAVSKAPSPANPASATATPTPTPPDTVIIPQCQGESGVPQYLELQAGKSKFLKLSEPISRLTIGNDGVANAKLVSPTSLYLVANGVGSTNMILQGTNQRCTVFDLLVQFDPEPLRATLRTIMPQEKGIVVRTVGDSIVLSGTVSNPVTAQQVESLARSYAVRVARNLDTLGSAGSGDGQRTNADTLVVNMLTVAAPQQVMLEVKVAEVSKKVLDEFGINFSRAFALADGSAIRYLNGILGGSLGVVGQITGTGPSGVPRSSVDSVVGGSLTGTNGSASAGTTISGGNVTVTYDANGRPTYTTTFGTVPGRGVTNATLAMQKQDGLVKILAEPTVMAVSGQEGSFLAGGKIFIPVAQSNTAGAVTTYTLEEKEFGVSLRFRPTVLGDGRINLQVNPEVSELSASGVTITSSATGAATVLPAFTTRKAATTVQLHDGQSFAIGGLMKSNVTGSINAFPILGELPVIGALFRSTSFQTDRSELVFIITPRLVKPLPADFSLPTDAYVEPSRSEVIFGGRLEGNKSDASGPATGGFEKR